LGNVGPMSNRKLEILPHNYIDGVMLSNDPIRFNIYRANGGIVIQVIHQDKLDRDHREQCNLYVVPDDKDISQTITKIITMEKLKS
jgi:hypothetical protein